MMKLSQSMVAFLVPLLFVACGDDPVDPDPGNGNGNGEEPEEGYTFVYTPPAGAPAITSITVPGTFNNWTVTATPMVKQADGSWQVTLDLDSAVTHQYKFFINDGWVNDMCNDATWGHPAEGHKVHLGADGCTSDGFTGQNAVLTLGPLPLAFSHTPTSPAHVSIADGRVSVRFRANVGHVQSAVLITEGATSPMHRQLTVGMQEVWRVSVPEGTSSYRIEVTTSTGTESFGPYTVPGNLFRSLEWVTRGVGYQIFPERFWNGDPTNDSITLSTDEFVYNELWTSNGPTLAPAWNTPPNSQHCCHQYYGGDLAGIVEKLDHLEQLGVTLIYLNPIFHAGSAHGYDIFDYMQVAPEFGGDEAARALLDAAHARGMRVMWDFVPNHVGVGHWAFQQAVQTGSSSQYWNWFYFHPDGDGLQSGDGDDYDAWWGHASLPELRTDHTAVFAHLMDVTRHWTEFGFDGIRVDVPFDIHNRSTFFPAFRNAAKSIDPEVYLIAEVWQRDASWLQGDQFDALMNYALGEEVVRAFAGGTMTATSAANAMAQLYSEYPEAASAMLFNLAASHDTDRLLTMLGGGELGATPSATALSRQRLASAMLYALPGIPVTWQGDECAFLGSSGDSHHRARFPLQWAACNAGMAAHYAQLGQLKHDIAALGTSVIRQHGAESSVLSFLRGEPGAGEMLGVFNNSSSIRAIDLPAGTWRDAVSGEALTESVAISGYGWRYLVKD